MTDDQLSSAGTAPDPAEVSIPAVGRVELAELVERGEVTLVEALPEEVFAAGHIPGAVNIRPRRSEELAPVLLPDLAAPIAVYCTDSECDASLRVAKRLRELGYTDVRRYTAGKRDWIGAGLPIEGGPPEAT